MSEQSSTGESEQQQAFQICQNRAAQVKVSSSRHSNLASSSDDDDCDAVTVSA